MTTAAVRVAPSPARRGVARRVPELLAVATILLEIGYPLIRGLGRDVLTVVTVVVFFLASTAHALVWQGGRWTAVLVATTAGGGLLVEAVGTRTGLPFGHYSYAHSLGPKIFGVPVVIPLAWTMMSYPALRVARRLGRNPWVRVLVGGWALASWDLFLDPQMVAAGHWRWSEIGATLPGIPGVPVGNYLGWLLAAVAMMAVLSTLLPADREPTDDRVPFGLYLWTWASSVLANFAFFSRPAVAVAGGIGMGLVAVPLAASLRRR